MYRKKLDIRGKTTQGELIPDKISTNKIQTENGRYKCKNTAQKKYFVEEQNEKIDSSVKTNCKIEDS